MNNITVNRQSGTPVYLQIRNQIREMILRGEAAEGSFLPSERAMARMMGLHRNTIIKAYHELKAEGCIASAQGKGYQVSYLRSGAAAENPEAEREPLRPRREIINWRGMIKESFLDMETTFDDLFSNSYNNGNISFAGGIASPDAYFSEELSEILTDLVEQSRHRGTAADDLYSYTPYQGMVELRKAIVMFLKAKGINVRHGEIQIVSEANQAIDFLAELLLQEGDTVITEEPVSPDVYRELTLAGANVITVPMDQEGMITDRMEPLIARHHPKLIYVNSSYHDPTGVAMSLERKKALLALAQKYRIPILEDDGTSEICFESRGVPSLKALDTADCVIYIYSFAMTFAPGIRVAFMAAPSIVIKNLSRLISIHLVSFDSLSQRILCEYLRRGIYQRNVEHICREYREKRDLMCRLLEPARELGLDFVKPGGGVYLWCRLPEPIDMDRFIALSGQKGVTFIPGHIFFPRGTKGEQYIRLNYSYPGKQQIRRGIRLLAEAMAESLR